jgi:O-antigen ligase
MNTVDAATDADADSVGKLVAWMFGFAPVLLFVLTWSGDLSEPQLLARAYALPVVFVELSTIFISFNQGFRLPRLGSVPLSLLGCLATLVWATALTSQEPATSLLRTGIWTVHLFFAAAVLNLWRHGMVDAKQHLLAIQSGFLVFFLLLIAFLLTTPQSPAERIWNLPAFGNIRWFGYYSAAIVGLCALGFMRRERFALLVASAAFAMAFWTGARGAVAASLIALAACTVLLPAFRAMRVWLLFGLCGLFGFAFALGIDAIVPMGNQGPDSMARFSDSGRAVVWQLAVEMIQERPLLGYGDGQFSLSLGGATFAQPHNFLLQLLHSWGIVGAALSLALLALMFPVFIRNDCSEAAPFQWAALAIGAYAFIDGALFYNQSISLFAFCCAAVFGLSRPPVATLAQVALGKRRRRGA